MNKAPAFPLYAQDFLSGVIYLTNEEIGIYIKMLCKQWTDGQIPKKRLGFLVGFDWENLSDELKDKFVDYGDFVANSRLEDERLKKEKFLKKQRLNGKKGGRPRKNEDSEKPNAFKKQNPKKGIYIEKEKEKESISLERGQGENFSFEEPTAWDFMRQNSPERAEAFLMQVRAENLIDDLPHFIGTFNNKVIEEELEFKVGILFARLNRLKSNWKRSGKQGQDKGAVSFSEGLRDSLGLSKAI